MDKSHGDVFRLPAGTKRFIAAFLAVILLIGTFTFWRFQRQILSEVEMQAGYSLKNVCSQNVLLAQSRIRDRQKFLRAAAEQVGSKEETDESGRMEILESYAANYGFYSMGIAGKDGICRTIRGEELDLTEHAYFQKSLNGEEIVTEERLSENQEEMVNIFATPIRKEGEITGVLTAAYKTADFLEMMDIRSFDGNGGSVLLDESGRMVSKPPSDALEVIRDMEELLAENPGWLANWGQVDSGALLRLGSQDGAYLACAGEVFPGGWYLVSFVKESYLYRDSRLLNRNLLSLILVLYGVIAVVSCMYLAVYRNLYRKQRLYGDVERQQRVYRRVEKEFQKALRQKAFQVWYQPKYDMRAKKICGAEALVRWKKADGSFLSPAQFIPELEETGHIVALDEEVLEMVCQDLAREREQGVFLGPVSVNLSKCHLTRPDLAERIAQITGRYGIRAGELSFELTESAAAACDEKELAALTERLHELGFQVDMDDFGTGSSTLQSLADTHFDTIKLDKGFVSLIGNPKMDIIIRSIIRMAQQLHMNMVAEGVETGKQAEFLVENQCYVAQGYFFFAPLPEAVYADKVRKQEEVEKA